MSVDSWKREIEHSPKVSSIPTQPELVFKPAEASDERLKEWEETELKWWADKQLLIIAIAVIIQAGMLGFMAVVMSITGVMFK